MSRTEKDVDASCKEAIGAGLPELVSALESKPRCRRLILLKCHLIASKYAPGDERRAERAAETAKSPPNAWLNRAAKSSPVKLQPIQRLVPSQAMRRIVRVCSR